jgi:hypothetical protein
MKRLVLVQLAAVFLFSQTAAAVSCDTGIKVWLNKSGIKLKVKAKGTFVFPDEDSDPTVVGANLGVQQGGAFFNMLLSPVTWTSLPNGKGFKSKGAACEVLLKSTRLKIKCDPGLTEESEFEHGVDFVGYEMQIGGAAYFGYCEPGTLKKGSPKVKIIDCPAVDGCM